MKNSYFLLFLFLFGLLYSCSETQEKVVSSESSAKLTAFNDFIPSYVAEVPNLEIEPGKYINRVIGKYTVDARVDSIHVKAVYLKIKDSKENIIFQGYAYNGYKNGWWEVSHKNKLMCCGNYISNKKSGLWSYYKLAEETQKFVHFKNDTLEGLAQEYSADSALLSQGNYVRGLKSDYWKYFYTNGKIKEQGSFYDGYKSGWWQSFEPNGNLLEEASYSRNEISGYTKQYFNGVIFEEGKLFNGRRRGSWKLYDDTGKLKRIFEHEE